MEAKVMDYLVLALIILVILLLAKWLYDNFRLDTIEFPWKIVLKRNAPRQLISLLARKNKTLLGERLDISNEFIGRNHELKLFGDFLEKFLDSQDDRVRAFLINGEQGIGKSWFLNQILAKFDEGESKTFFIDLSIEKSKGFDVTRGFQFEIRKQAHALKIDNFFDTYDNRLKELAVLQEEKFPLENDFLGMWGQETSTDLLIEAINRVSDKNPIVIAIDSFEAESDFSDWFLNYFMKKLKGKILIVVSGQRDTFLRFVQVLGSDRLKSVTLGAFTQQDLHNYLLKQNFKFDEQSAQSLTGGNPLALSFLTALASNKSLSDFPSLKSEFTYNLVSLLLPDLPAEERETIYTMAVLRFFDDAILSEILDDYVEVEYLARKYRFMRFSENGWQLHELVSRSARLFVQQTNPDKFKSINKKAMSFWKKRLARLDKEIDPPSTYYDTRWTNAINMLFWHLLALDEDAACRFVISQFVTALTYRLYFVTLLDATNEYKSKNLSQIVNNLRLLRKNGKAGNVVKVIANLDEIGRSEFCDLEAKASIRQLLEVTERRLSSHTKDPKIIKTDNPNDEDDWWAGGGSDCACSLAVLPSQTSITEITVDEKLKIAPSTRNISLDDEFSIWFGIQHRPVVLNKIATEIVSFFKKPSTLSEIVVSHIEFAPKIITDVVEELKRSRLLIGEDEFLDIDTYPQEVSAWVHITDRCNLRCEYCYLPHVKEDMSWETGVTTINAIIRSAIQQHIRKVKIKYAGGEPLIRSDFLFDLHNCARKAAKDSNIELDAIVLSNGTLLNEEIIQNMKNSSLRLMISLDGVGHQHDIQRPYAGGKGSFADVKRGILLAINHQIRPDISITISGKNALGVSEVVEWVLDHDLPFSLNFYRENELSMSTEALQFDEMNIIQGMLEAYKVIENHLPSRSLLGSLVDRANLSSPHLKTCGVGENYLVFDQKGMVSKCQMAMKHPITNSQSENLLTVIQEDKSGIQNISVDEKEGCKDCEWKYWCAGGCPLVTYRATGRYDVKSPNCNIYKTLYPEAVRLEGLRIVKQSFH